MIFINTLCSGLGGEGHVETEWLEQTLEQHRDAQHKPEPIELATELTSLIVPPIRFIAWTVARVTFCTALI